MPRSPAGSHAGRPPRRSRWGWARSLGGALVSLADPSEVADGALAGYGLAALVGAAAALVYLAAVAALVHEPAHEAHIQDAGHSAARRIRMVFATARAEIAASITVRVIFATAVAFGFAMSAVELLWQPHLAEELGGDARHGFEFGALAAGSMLAVAIGAASSPRLRGSLGLRVGYLAALGLVAVSTALLGAPDAPLAFVALYLATYLSYGFVEPMHVELLNEAVGSEARATLISGESLAAQGGALVANLTVGALAAAEGTATAWAVAGAFLAVTGLLVAQAASPGARAAAARPSDANLRGFPDALRTICPEGGGLCELWPSPRRPSA